ncbi:MAG: hypothetical protein ABR537_02170 [Gemmatimonadales bacterium]
MRTAALCALLAAAGCSSWPINLREVPGTYVMNRGRAADTLVIQPQGRYVHMYRAPGQPVVVDVGAWSIDTIHKQAVVTLHGFWQRWRTETEASELLRHPLAPGLWQVTPQRDALGRLRLMVDEDIEWLYVRRGRAR